MSYKQSKFTAEKFYSIPVEGESSYRMSSSYEDELRVDKNKVQPGRNYYLFAFFVLFEIQNRNSEYIFL